MRTQLSCSRQQPFERSSSLFAPPLPGAERFSAPSDKPPRISIYQNIFFQIAIRRVFERLKEFFLNLPLGKILIRYKISYETAPERIIARYNKSRFDYHLAHAQRYMAINSIYKGEQKVEMLNQLNADTEGHLASADRCEKEAIEIVKKYPYWPMFILFT